MTVKVFISPDYSQVPPDKDNGGIRRVVEAKLRHLPKFGIEIVHSPSQADIICNNGSMLTSFGTAPIVNVNHGLYWSRQPWEAGYQEVNALVVESMIRAVAHTAPSEWVANAIRRGGFFYPEVVYHGVDAEDFSPSKSHSDYVLWNKARPDFVSDPGDMMKVAARTPNLQYVTTIGRPAPNIRIVGTTSHEQMKTLVANAGVYLATARETFGIGTLEAMASGVPVAGWNWGGQSEIIVQGQTGFLAPPGDYRALAECIQRCLDERHRLSKNCMEDVRIRWQWEPRIQQYANIFKRVYADYYEQERPRVSVIVTAYKLDTYLPMCLDSISKQTMNDFECLVIDDAQLESTRIIVESHAGRDQRFKYIPTPHNLGLPGARNFGFSKSSGLYIRHVDADDYLAENALQLEADALDQDPGIHIVYGHLETVNEDGSRITVHGQVARGDWPPEQFSWIGQMSHLNQLPSCSMMRRIVMQNSGGYRERMTRQEDAEFWCRTTSLGFRAKKITQAVTYYHRQRNDSKGAVEWQVNGHEPDWTAWFPWRTGAHDYQQAVKVLRKYSGNHPAPHLVPFGAQGKSPIASFWQVHDFAYPVVSVIVTCGPSHEKYLLDALDSIQAQSYPDWECIVVNDTGNTWSGDIMGAPWAQVVTTGGNLGASVARNTGFKHARGRYIIWLDADDYWLPWYLELMVAHAEKNDGIIYSNLIIDDGKEKKVYRYDKFDSEQVAKHMGYPGSSILFPRKIVEAVITLQGGWDIQIPGMEDWDFQIAAHSLGFCAYHVPEPLFVYRKYSSTKRDNDYAKIDSILAYMDQKWHKYRKDGEKMGCGCGGTKTVNRIPDSIMSSSGNFKTEGGENIKIDSPTQMVQVEYVGPIAEDFQIRSRVDMGIFYRFGNNQYNKERTVFAEDAAFLMGLMDGEGKSLYRILGAATSEENRNPAEVLGETIVA